ncbi:hypothetical protein AB0K15_30665 [Amycolatopsis sp. NPDC049253]|uniref:hypothetical protein n=1 Tax=Amycolatopsis sp. NPDC049253 TaxID=3155274 RepID=UPI0034151F55
MAGLHLGVPAPLPAFQGDRYWDITGGAPVPEDASPELRHDLSMFVETLASHGAVHTLRRADPHPRAQRLAGRHARLNPQAVEELE